MAYRVIRPKSHEEWLEERTKGIGSSEAGTIMGVNHFDTAYKLWRRKSGIDGPVEMNEAMELGHHMEDAVATMFASHTGAFIVSSSKGDWIAADKNKDYLRVSPDRLFFYPGEEHKKANQHILECKTSSVAVDKNDIPAYWYCQLQYQMGVMGVKKGALAWISAYPKLHFDFLEVDFNKSFYDLLIQTIDKFWNVNILQGVAPDDMRPEDTLLRYPKSTEGTSAFASSEILEKYEYLKEVNSKLKIMDETKTELEGEIKQAMGPNETLVTPEGVIIAQWKSMKDSQKFNSKAFLAADPEGYAKYVETIPGGRRFTIK